VSTPQNEPEVVSFRLSPQQEQLRADNATPVSQVAAVLRGPLDEAALRAALEQAVGRHEILRTAVVTPAGMRAPQQVIHERLAPGWASAGESAAELLGDRHLLERVLAREAAEVDIEHGPIVRALLAGSGEEQGVLVLSAAATSADAGSLLILIDELTRSGERDDGAEPIQYADYAEWRHQLIAGDEAGADEGRAFWGQESAALPSPPRLLFGSWDSPRAGPPAAVPIKLEAEVLEHVQRAADAAAVSVPTFLEAAWHALIGRLTGVSELAIVRWLDGREQLDLALAVGPYTQPVPIHSRCEAGTSFAEILDQVRRAGTQAARWQDYASANELAELMRMAPIGFAHTSLDAAAPAVLDVASLSPPLPMAPLLLHCFGNGVLRVKLRHDPAAVSPDDAAEISARFATVLASAAADPTQAVAGLALMDATERSRLLAGAAAPAPAPAVHAATPVHHRFEEQSRLTPDRPAVNSSVGGSSYAELNAAANRLAHHLRDAGVVANAAVGLCMERTPAMVTALLAILKAGGAYVPLNYEHPPARIAEQLAQADARFLVTQEHLLDRLSSFAGTVVCVERDAREIDARPSANVDHSAQPQDLVYVMYTSGSTGVPKGVEVTHGNLANYTAYMADRLGARDPQASTGLQFAVVSAISTDLGNTSIFPALATGGCIHLIDAAAAMDGDALAAYAADHPLDVLKITPSHLRALLGGSRPAGVLPRRWLVVGGEALSWDLMARVRGLSPQCRLMNHYGPTETTVGCATYDVDAAARDDAATVPIGRPIAGASAYVLDAEREPVAVGVPGELYVGGAGVAAGYAGNPAETAERFVQDPFVADGAARMYRTGDRARYLRDGAVEFLGRVDDQVKIRGYRIEPGEIEVALMRHPAIRQAAVSVDEGEGGERRLMAYLVASEEPTVEEVQAFLSQSLPDYMVPSAFATLESLPFTPSGKVDRKALAGLVAAETRRDAKFVAPRDTLEEEIASIWSELLGVERVGVFDDFFALGGHSLLATQAIIRIRRSHGDIPLRALLAAPTVATLAEVVRSAGGASVAGGDRH
jgi:amino acid adenylation domain-containing protein